MHVATDARFLIVFISNCHANELRSVSGCARALPLFWIVVDLYCAQPNTHTHTSACRNLNLEINTPGCYSSHELQLKTKSNPWWKSDFGSALGLGRALYSGLPNLGRSESQFWQTPEMNREHDLSSCNHNQSQFTTPQHGSSSRQGSSLLP